MFSVDVNLQNCGTINKLLRCSISNCNSKIPSFMFCVDVNLQDCSTINKLLRHSVSNFNPKISFFTLDIYEFPRLYNHTQTVGTFTSL